MANLKIVALLAAAAGALLPGVVRAEGSRSSVAVYYPGQSWYLRYEADGVLEKYNNHKQGQSTYATAVCESTGVLVSAQINPASQATTAAQCREDEYAHIRSKEANAEVKFSEANGTDLEVTVVVGPPDGRATSRHLHRFWLRDGLCAKVHVSKTPFLDRDAEALGRILASARPEAVPAAGALDRAFALPGRGTLIVNVPASWGFRTSKPGPMAPREVTFMDPAGDHQVQLTLVPNPRVLKDRTVRSLVEAARDAARAHALETDVPLQDLKGAEGNGHYFSVTDKALVGKPPRENNWKYVDQGALMIGETLLVFSVFSNTKDSPAVASAFAAIREARID
jgi:hypothetical protein